MPTIHNKTDQRVLLRFNSGLTRHLAPHETLEGVEHVEVKANERLRALEARHVIALYEAGAPDLLRSGSMTAAEAVAHIEATALEALRHFLSPDEERVTVLRAMEAKRTA